MALDRPIGPGERDPRFDGVVIVIEPLGKALQGVQRTGRRALQPRIKRGRLALAYALRKVLGEVHRLGHLGRLHVELRGLCRKFCLEGHEGVSCPGLCGA